MQIIETPRLLLRKFQKEDVEDLFLIMKDEEVNTFLPWFPFTTLDQTKQYLQQHFLDYYDQDQQGLRLAICLKSDQKPIGYLHVSEDESHDFGYGLRKEFWHQGIVREAAMASLPFIKALSIPYITATHDIKNPRSGNVMKAIGMKYCYTYEEHWMPKDIKVRFRMYQMNFDGSDYVYQKYWNMYPHEIENIE